MERLPILSGARLIKILANFGYRIDRQRGSHIRLKAEGRRPVTVPDYKTIDRSLLKKILHQANIDTEDFLNSFRKR